MNLRISGTLILFTFVTFFFNNCGTPKVRPESDPASSTEEVPLSPSRMPSPDPSPARSLGCLEQHGTNAEWSNETEVIIENYSANAMEPKLSANGVVLFWNDKPANDEQMQIHYAIKQNSGHYAYVGPLSGVNSADYLDGTPAVDKDGNFYFVSTRSYSESLQTIYGGVVEVLGIGSMRVTGVAAAGDAVKANVSMVLDSDVDVSWDGQVLVATRSVFAGKAFPESSSLKMFQISNRVASELPNSVALLNNVNKPNCAVYAGSLSRDLKELYYTVFPSGVAPSQQDLRILVAKRSSVTDPFSEGQIILGIQGTATEGPDISHYDGGKTLIYHRIDPSTGRFKIFQVTRP